MKASKVIIESNDISVILRQAEFTNNVLLSLLTNFSKYSILKNRNKSAGNVALLVPIQTPTV